VKYTSDGSASARWAFLAHLVELEMVACDAVYSVLLERELEGTSEPRFNDHCICVSNTWTITLGHGVITRDSNWLIDSVSVLAHTFFGNYDKILDELSQFDGFFKADGVMTCDGVKRDTDGLICGLLDARNDDNSFRMDGQCRQGVFV
jgi:hypothetical protein